MPRGVVIPAPEDLYADPFRNEWLYLKDCRFEDIAEAAVAGRNYYDPRTDVNAENIALSDTPLFLVFPQFSSGASRIPPDKLQVKGPGDRYWTVRQLSHGLHVEIDGGAHPSLRRQVDTRYEVAGLPACFTSR